jgi:hypothetical protein
MKKHRKIIRKHLLPITGKYSHGYTIKLPKEYEKTPENYTETFITNSAKNF